MRHTFRVTHLAVMLALVALAATGGAGWGWLIAAWGS